MIDISELIKNAILEKNGTKKEAYRALKAAILLAETAKNAKEVDVYALVRKLIKEREDSASIYDANSRKDLADIEREQAKYLKELLPAEPSKEDLLTFLELFTPYSKKDMGVIIKSMKAEFPGASPQTIANLVKESCE